MALCLASLCLPAPVLPTNTIPAAAIPVPNADIVCLIWSINIAT